MILYKSTRGSGKKYTFSQVLLKGIAEDGGLFLPVKIPQFSLKDIEKLQHKSYQEIALFIMKLLETDFPEPVLRDLINKAYGQNFDNPQIAPLVHIKENEYILELWHGPTAAFKDMALQLMPLLFSQALSSKKEEPKKYLILVATSGDTGAAALEGYKNKKGIKIIVLFPQNQVSSIQELTMTTFKAENGKVIAINGDFDDAQTLVKDIFNDRKFNEKLLTKYGVSLSAANSINWGRLVPQLFYYLVSYVRLLEEKKIKIGSEIDIAVPSGNFGNLFAAFFMKQMGLPIRKFICASNSNNVLTQFFQTGVYDISNRDIIATPSPSMNILVSSNLERFLYLITNNSVRVKEWMKDLKEKKRFTIDTDTRKKIGEFIFADWVDNTDGLTCIKNTLEKTGYLLDPHTAVATEVANRYKSQTKSEDVPLIICSTAHWSKFPRHVFAAINGASQEKNIFKLLSLIKQKAPKTQIPPNILALQKKEKTNIPVLPPSKDVIEEAILNFLSPHQ